MWVQQRQGDLQGDAVDNLTGVILLTICKAHFK